MNVTYKDYRGNAHAFTIAEAVNHAATPNPYSYGGSVEKLQRENENLREIVGKLIQVIYGDEATRLSKPQQLQFILGYGYEVE